MIRQLAQCPYCNHCEVALNDNPEIVFNPDGGPPGPCPHLVWVDGGYSQWELSTLPGRKTRIPRMVGLTEFEWLHPGLEGAEDADRLRAYLKDLVTSGAGWEFAPRQEHVVRSITRDQTVRGPDGRDHPSWEVEGAAVFARDAAAFVAEVPAAMARQAALWPEPPGFTRT
jgi:hypothetical protein